MCFAGIHPDLLSCMNRVYLRGCEAAYLGRMVDTSKFCPVRETPLLPASSFRGVNAASGSDPKEPGESTGSLVLHIRSGDIFYQGSDRRRYGQVGKCDAYANTSFLSNKTSFSTKILRIISASSPRTFGA